MVTLVISFIASFIFYFVHVQMPQIKEKEKKFFFDSEDVQFDNKSRIQYSDSNVSAEDERDFGGFN